MDTSASRPKGGSRLFWVGLAVVLMLALLPRLFYPSSRFMLWYDRSVRFWDALGAGEFADTYQQYHPGVTTMWIAGFGLRLYMVVRGWSSDKLLHPPSALSGPQGGPAQVGTAALGFSIALCIVLVYVVLDRMTNRRVAFCAGCFLALDPFYITHSKMIHVDALLASFMLISALFLVNYIRKGNWTHLVVSGIFAGLAFLTKSPSLFLIPYAVFVIISGRLAASDAAWDLSDARAWGRQLWRISRSLIIWMLVAVCIFFLLWPAMWVEPWKTVSKIARNAYHHMETPHPTATFFTGRITNQLGLSYYLANIVWKTTLVTLPAICAAGLLLVLQRPNKEAGLPARYMLVYAIGFLFLMTLSAKKWARYILPTFVALDVVAAWGLAQITNIVGKHDRLQKWSRLPVAMVTIALVGQAILVLRCHPYYGTHHNLLVGGSPVARHILHLGDEGEGLDLAANFLNQRPGAERLTVGVQDVNDLMFKSNFVGSVESITHPDIDYKVYFIHNTQRNKGVYRWEEIQKAYDEAGELVWSASFDGVPYVWISRAYPHDPQAFAVDHPSNVKLGDHIYLWGYWLSSSDLSANDTLTVTLLWQSTKRLSEDYHVFVHLQDADGALVVQHDSIPLYGERPTWSWQEDEVLQDAHALFIEDSMLDGNYTLSVGMYDYPSGARLPATDLAGNHLIENRVILQEIRITSLN
jgi:hypothetical protein